MFKYITVKEQVLTERKKNAQLAAENVKLKSDLDYVAMMCDIDLDTETNEQEAEDNG
jgi:hypothetical protein